MIAYIICSCLLLILCAFGAKAVLKQTRHKKKQLAIAISYDRIIRESKLSIEYSDFLCYRYIGMDKRNRKLVLIDHCNGEKQELCIPILEIGDSKIIQVKDQSQGIAAILLELRNKRNNKPVRFCFYDKQFDPLVELPSRSRKAIHWKTRVDLHKHPGNVSLEADYVL